MVNNKELVKETFKELAILFCESDTFSKAEAHLIFEIPYNEAFAPDPSYCVSLPGCNYERSLYVNKQKLKKPLLQSGTFTFS